MKIEGFNESSSVGKATYAAASLENYALKVKPRGNWKPFFNKAWEVVKGYEWDNWASDFIEYIPEYTFEFETFEESDFECLSKREYDVLKELYAGLPDRWSEMLEDYRDLILAYGYDCGDYDGTGERCFQSLVKAVVDEGAELPSFSPKDVSLASERNGYGEAVDPLKYSKIL